MGAGQQSEWIASPTFVCSLSSFLFTWLDKQESLPAPPDITYPDTPATWKPAQVAADWGERAVFDKLIDWIHHTPSRHLAMRTSYSSSPQVLELLPT